MPLKKKKFNARFPAGRIKKIMQTDEEVGKVAQAVPIIISRTLEMFVESLLTKSLHITIGRNAKTLSPSHLKQCILAEQRFDFLRDLVKNIPDISSAEEKEISQNWSAENSPNTCRFYDSKKIKLTQSSIPSQNNNAHSSDSSSDCEAAAKIKLGLLGNGRYPALKVHEEEFSSKAPIPYDVSINPIPVPSNSSVITTQSHISMPPMNQHRYNRPTNFYQETLRDEEDKRDSPPVHSSVIQPNPEYSGSTAAKVQISTHYPHSTDQAKSNVGYLKNSVGGSISTKPVFHIDLSSISTTPGSDSLGSPFTPTLLRQSQTPLIAETSTLNITDSIGKTAFHRSESLNQYKKGPPPLQTLKKASSFDNSKMSVGFVGQQNTDNILPQIKIDVSTDGPKFHLDLSNFKFDSTPCPSVLTPKKRKITPTEPPGLLPISPALNLSKNAATSTQLDEDYDT